MIVRQKHYDFLAVADYRVIPSIDILRQREAVRAMEYAHGGDGGGPRACARRPASCAAQLAPAMGPPTASRPRA